MIYGCQKNCTKTARNPVSPRHTCRTSTLTVESGRLDGSCDPHAAPLIETHFIDGSNKPKLSPTRNVRARRVCLSRPLPRRSRRLFKGCHCEQGVELPCLQSTWRQRLHRGPCGVYRESLPILGRCEAPFHRCCWINSWPTLAHRRACTRAALGTSQLVRAAPLAPAFPPLQGVNELGIRDNSTTPLVETARGVVRTPFPTAARAALRLGDSRRHVFASASSSLEVPAPLFRHWPRL